VSRSVGVDEKVTDYLFWGILLTPILSFLILSKRPALSLLIFVGSILAYGYYDKIMSTTRIKMDLFFVYPALALNLLLAILALVAMQKKKE